MQDTTIRIPTVTPFHKQLGVFPLKLYDMLEDAEKCRFDHIISWLPNGTGFKVHQPNELVERILPNYFNLQTRYKSFQRQLNMYEFRMLRKAAKGSQEEKFKGAFFHPMFIRGKKEICAMIPRKNVSGRPSFCRLVLGVESSNTPTTAVFDENRQEWYVLIPTSTTTSHNAGASRGTNATTTASSTINRNNDSDSSNAPQFRNLFSVPIVGNSKKEGQDCKMHSRDLSTTNPMNTSEAHHDLSGKKTQNLMKSSNSSGDDSITSIIDSTALSEQCLSTNVCHYHGHDFALPGRTAVPSTGYISKEERATIITPAMVIPQYSFSFERNNGDLAHFEKHYKKGGHLHRKERAMTCSEQPSVLFVRAEQPAQTQDYREVPTVMLDGLSNIMNIAVSTMVNDTEKTQQTSADVVSFPLAFDQASPLSRQNNEAVKPSPPYWYKQHESSLLDFAIAMSKNQQQRQLDTGSTVSTEAIFSCNKKNTQHLQSGDHLRSIGWGRTNCWIPLDDSATSHIKESDIVDSIISIFCNDKGH